MKRQGKKQHTYADYVQWHRSVYGTSRPPLPLARWTELRQAMIESVREQQARERERAAQAAMAMLPDLVAAINERRGA